jgi:flagellar hook-associated protein 2
LLFSEVCHRAGASRPVTGFQRQQRQRMATITAPGIGSGLDVNGIITQLMALERRPLNVLDSRKSQLNAQISAYGKLKSALATFQGAMQKLAALDRFQVFTTSSTAEAIATATAGPGAAGGTIDVVVTQLAARHKLASTPFLSADETVGAGTLSIAVGADSFDVTLASGTDTLAALRDAINSSPDNTGVTATVLNEVAGSRLVLTSRDSGTANAISLSGGLAATLGMTEVAAAADAELTVDGFPVVSPSNTVTGAVGGVTLSLKGVSPDPAVPATLTFERDDEAIRKSVQEFADAFNALRDSINELRKKELKGDFSLTGIESSLVGVLGSGASLSVGSFSYLAEIGVALDKNGKLQVDATRLTAAMSLDFSGVANLFADGTQGVAKRLADLAGQFTSVDGLVAQREDGLNSRIRSMESQRTQIERRLAMTETRLRAQFTALDSLVAQLQSTSAFLTQRLSALNNNG